MLRECQQRQFKLESLTFPRFSSDGVTLCDHGVLENLGEFCLCLVARVLRLGVRIAGTPATNGA